MNLRRCTKKAVGLALCVVFILLAVIIPVQAGHIHYEYDELGRLTSVTYGNGVSRTYTYDSGGNMLQSTSKIVLTVLSTDPAGEETGVPINKVIHINFSQAITAADNFNSISLKQGDTPVNITTSIADDILSVMPTGNLDISTIYTVYIPAGAVQNPDAEVNQELSFSFTTSANALTVVTESAVNIHQVGAALNGTISGLANEENCDQVKFQYKEQDGSEWIDTSIQTGSFGTGAFTDYIAGLTPETSYLYRAMAHNSLGWIPGETQSFTTEQVNPELSARGWIDAPAAGDIICGAHYNVHGWYLDGAGVTNLEIQIDGTTVGQAVYGDQRLDVLAAYPDYNNANAGFHYTLDTTVLSNGEHTLTVTETNTLDQSSSKEVSFNVDNTGVLPAMGWIDAPAAGTTISGANYNVHGWYLDGAGVTNIEIQIDGTTVGEAVYGNQRLDVQTAYPDYNDPNSGFHYTLDTTALSNGEHTLTAVETNTLDQSSSKEVTFNVYNSGILPAKGWIDAPASGATISGSNYNVHGWYLDGAGVSMIEIQIDGTTVGEAVYGDQRLDVQAAYPDYNDPNSGFHYTLDTMALSNGEHTLTAVETNTLDQSSSKEVMFNVENPGVLPARGWIDAPASGATISGANYNVHGWYLDGAGVTNIEIQVDGTTVGEAVYGDQRLDVQAAYPDNNDANSGFHYTLDTTALTNDEHTLTVVETNTLDQTSSKQVTFNVENPGVLPAKGWIDAPASGATISGTNYNVHGWYLDGAGVSMIEIQIDGTTVGEAVYGDQRLDVQTAYPDYNAPNSGFHYTLDTTAFSNGEHTLTVVETNAFDQSSSKEVTFNVSNSEALPAIGCIEVPASEAVISGTDYNVQGWYLDGEEVSKVEIMVDEIILGEAVYGDSRPDVQTAYPDYNNGNSGFHYILDTTALSNGEHTLIVVETNTLDQTSAKQVKFTVNN